MDGHPQRYAHEWCAKVMPFIQLMQAQEKDLIRTLWSLLVDDLYAALPKLNPQYKLSRSKRSAKKLKKSNRSNKKRKITREEKVRRGLGAVILSAIPGLITLAVESLSSWIKGKQNNRIDNAVSAMRRSSSEVRNELTHYRDDFLMYGKYTAESLNDVIKTVNALHQKNTRLE